MASAGVLDHLIADRVIIANLPKHSAGSLVGVDEGFEKKKDFHFSHILIRSVLARMTVFPCRQKATPWVDCRYLYPYLRDSFTAN